MQGSSLVPLMRGQSPDSWRPSFYYHYYESGGHGVPAHYGVVDARYKLVHFYEPSLDYWEMYDRKLDPQELNSVYDDPSYAETQRRLRKELRRLRREYQVSNDN